MVGVTLPDGCCGEIGLRLQGSKEGLMWAGAAVLLVPTHQALKTGNMGLPVWEKNPAISKLHFSELFID